MAATRRTTQLTERRDRPIKKGERLSELGEESWAGKTVGPATGKEGHHHQLVRKCRPRERERGAHSH